MKSLITFLMMMVAFAAGAQNWDLTKSELMTKLRSEGNRAQYDEEGDIIMNATGLTIGFIYKL